MRCSISLLIGRLQGPVGDALALDQDIDQDIADQRRSRRRLLGEVLGVNRVEAGEVFAPLARISHQLS
jgi:hypothetical protein